MAMQRKTIGLTLLTLVIVFILFAIARIEYQDAKVRTSIAQVKSDQQNLATAIESYYIYYNVYPAPELDSEGNTVPPDFLTKKHLYAGLATQSIRTVGTQTTYTFATITIEPWLSGMPKDPFNNGGNGFYHYSPGWGQCWIVSSYGPDEVDGYGTTKFNLEHFIIEPIVIDPNSASSTLLQYAAPFPLQSSSFTYDPTNGLRSGGDIWRRGP
jgi:Tfp pilus assembly protein PilE